MRGATQQTEPVTFGHGDSMARDSGNTLSCFLSTGLLGALPIDLTHAEGRRQAFSLMRPLWGRQQGGDEEMDLEGQTMGSAT